MKWRDILLTFCIFIGFILIYAVSLFSIGIDNINKNWNKYRCNPSVLPFAGLLGHDVSKTFEYCIQGIQQSQMGIFMEPINEAMNMVGSVLGEVNSSLQSIRNMFDYVRNAIMSIIHKVFSVFSNLIIEIQVFIIKFRDIIQKMIGILITQMYLIQGAIYAGESTMAGPVGKTIKFVGNLACFHKDTLVKMKNGTFKKINNIKLNDELDNENKVIGVMKLCGSKKQPFYTLSNKDGSNIFVTGSHYVLYNNDFIQVKDHPNSIATNDFNKTVYCLITDKHQIPIGDYIFWDWEDEKHLANYNIRQKK